MRHNDARLEIPLWTGLRLQALPIAGACETEPIALERRALTPPAQPLKDMESALIRKAVEDARGNVALAAQQLGVSRATVYRKLGLKRD